VMMRSGQIKMAASAGAGEHPSELMVWSEDEIRALPLVNLNPIPEVPPVVNLFPRKIWASNFFSYSLRPSITPTNDYFGSALTLVGDEDQGQMIEAEVLKYQSFGYPMFVASNKGNPTGNLNLTVAWWASGADINGLRAAVNRA